MRCPVPLASYTVGTLHPPSRFQFFQNLPQIQNLHEVVSHRSSVPSPLSGEDPGPSFALRSYVSPLLAGGTLDPVISSEAINPWEVAFAGCVS